MHWSGYLGWIIAILVILIANPFGFNSIDKVSEYIPTDLGLSSQSRVCGQPIEDVKNRLSSKQFSGYIEYAESKNFVSKSDAESYINNFKMLTEHNICGDANQYTVHRFVEHYTSPNSQVDKQHKFQVCNPQNRSYSVETACY